MPGAALREQGMNRIGNLIVPNNNYCAFEDWLIPILDRLLAEQENGTGGDGDGHTEGLSNWTPSKLIHRLGLEINDERSVCYWAAKNSIPIFCPALTDGSLGDMLYFHSFKAAEPGRHPRPPAQRARHPEIPRFPLIETADRRSATEVPGASPDKPPRPANRCRACDR